MAPRDLLNTCSWPGCVAAHDNTNAEPLLIPGSDVHLLAPSPLRDAGVFVGVLTPLHPAVDLTHVAGDLDGECRDEQPDIGADELR